MTADVSLQTASLEHSAALSQTWLDLLPSESVQVLCDHPLLVAFANGDAELPTLQELLAQHHHYAQYFTRFLCALISNLPEIEDVKVLVQNLVEELGADQPDGVSHAQLFLRSLQAVAVVPHSRVPLGATKELTAAMFHYCRSPDPLEGLAAMCLGAEAIVPLIYRPIITAMNSLGISEMGRRFFDLHVAEDEGHALAMLQIMIRLIDGDRQREARVTAVGKAMIARRVQFLDAVWTAGSATASAAIPRSGDHVRYRA